MAYRPPRAQQRNENRPQIGLQLAKPAGRTTATTKILSAPDLANEEAFPNLGGLGVVKTDQTLNFASAASKEEEEVTSYEEAGEDDNVPLGWISMRSGDRRVIDKRSKRPPPSEQLDPILVRRAVEAMVARWEGEREALNALLGDRSPYWNALPLGEEDDDES